MSDKRVVRLGLAILLLTMSLSACDLGPAPTSTVAPTSTPIPTVPPPPPATKTPVPPEPTDTPMPQPTDTAVPSPTATQPAPAPTKGSAFKYTAPVLKEPKDKGGYAGQLIWEPEEDLAVDEYYHIFIHSVHNNELRHWGFDTELGKKEGKFLLPREQFGDKDNNWKTLSDTGEFTWEVQIMHKLDSGGNEPVSPISETWSFMWYRSTD